MRTANKVLSICVLIVFVMSFFAVPSSKVFAVSDSIVISQVYGGGGNSGATLKNDFIELFNRGTTDVDLTGWSVQYGSAGGTGNWSFTPLTGVIHPGGYHLIQEAAGSGGTMDLPTPDDTGSLSMSGTSGKVALVHSTTALSGACPAGVTDVIGYGSANCSETAPAPILTNITADFRNNGGCTDTDDNSADFAVATPAPRNSASPLQICGGAPTPTNPSAVGSATPNTLLAGDPVLLKLVVTPGANPTSTGLAATCDLSSIGGSATQSFFDDGTNGDVTAGDNTFSFSTTIVDTSIGAKSLSCSITDAEARTGSASIALTIPQIIPIGAVNGAVSDIEDATAHRSPFAPATGNSAGSTVVAVQGVVYEKTLQASGYPYGMFIQNTAETADSDPNTSDGLFIFLGKYDDILGPDGYYVPQVGDELIISGKISEYYNMTEMSSSLKILKIVRSGVDIEANITPVVANPTANLADANRYWERLQGMRVQVPQNSIVLGGRNVFSPADAEVWVAAPDSTVALREDPYTNRAFRDAHPLDDNYSATDWDGNGYRILMGSLGIKGTNTDATALIDPARTFDTVTNAPAGGLNYTYKKYRIEITDQPAYAQGLDPAANNPPTAIADRTAEYSIVDYNLENLYDYRNNPFSKCDFEGDTNCIAVAPFKDDIKSPFNYVPASDAVYQARLTDIATQIINDLHSPDVLMVQEVENQDICSVEGSALVCGITDNADGKPDVLQELALKIADLGGPAYDAAFDRDSSDLRGITPAYMYRTDRVELLSPVGDPILGTTPTIEYPGAGVAANADVSNPKTFNADLPAGITACETDWVFPRAAQVALFRIHSTDLADPVYSDVYTINNHFKSGPDGCIDHRTEQAKYNAALIAAIEATNPYARIIMGGDLNVYPRPDDIALGASDQLGSLYDPALGLTNLWEVLLGQAPEAAYSYVYLGMAQTLDQMFANQATMSDLHEFRIAHINSDFPAEFADDVARGTSDHDPNVATFGFSQSPVVTSISPDQLQAGSPEFTLTVNGTGFTPGATIQWNGVDRATTFVSDTQLTATITAADVATLGTAEVTVVGASGLVSNVVDFKIYQFADVLPGSWSYSYVQGLYSAGITTGCSVAPLRFCPQNPVSRAQMAVFLLKAEHGSDYVPPAASGTLFSDVPADHWAAAWIERLAAEGITTGCSAGMYCPQNPVTRAQMAIFLLKGKYGSDYVPPAASGTSFSDVPVTYWAAAWIENLAAEGITTGCSADMYCPQNPVTRAQMAVFIDKTFDIPLVP